MVKINLDQLVAISPKEEAENLLKNGEIKRRVEFLGKRGVKLKEIYKRIFYDYKKCPVNENDSAEEISHEEKFNRLFFYTLYSGILSSLSSGLAYAVLKNNFNFYIGIETMLPSFLLYMNALYFHNAYRNKAIQKAIKYKNSVTNAVNELYLLKSKEYLNAF